MLFLTAQVPHEDRRPDREDAAVDAREPGGQGDLGAEERAGQAGQIRRGQRHRLLPQLRQQAQRHWQRVGAGQAVHGLRQVQHGPGAEEDHRRPLGRFSHGGILSN